MKSGVIAILLVILISVIGLFVLVSWQSRLLVAVHRFQSLSDLVTATYVAESEIYDWVARFLGPYTDAFSSPFTSSTSLPDGTSLTVEGKSPDSSSQTLSVIASRQFATTKIELARTQSTQALTQFKSLQIALAVDCTSSMNEPADSFCREKCCDNANCDSARPEGTTQYRRCMDRTVRPDGSPCSTRLQEMKKAALVFINSVDSFASQHLDREVLTRLGVFRVDAAWVIGASSSPSQVKSALENYIGRWHSGEGGSPMCGLVAGATSVGSGFDLANSLFKDNSRPDRKQVVVLITDGEPNSRHSSYTDTAVCGTRTCEVSQCLPAQPVEYLRCSLTSTNDGGIRLPETDAYAVTTLDFPPSAVEQIFSDTQYVAGYYNSSSATELTANLQKVFQDIVTTTGFIRIRRVVN